MKCVHPNLRPAAAVIAIALALTAGCRNQQSGSMANPFLAPNRVTPPATRSLMPGQAQPYYPGDPVPVMQSGVAQPADAAQLAAAPEPEMPSATENLAWMSPRGGGTVPAAPSVAPPAAVQQASANPAPTTIASNEPAVAIPDDGNSLRFALPSPAPQEPQQFIATAPTPIPTNPQSPTLQQAPQPAAATAPQSIQQAAYTEPVMTNSQVAAASPWRTPEIAPATPAPTTNPYPPSIAAQAFGPPLAMSAPATMTPYGQASANSMEVTMREVPSPAMPRIRIPGYQSTPTIVGSADGFRPRTSMR